MKNHQYLEGLDLWEPFSDPHLIENRDRIKLFKEYWDSINKVLDYRYSKSTIKRNLKGSSYVKRNLGYSIMRELAVKFFKYKKLAKVGLLLN